MCHAYIRDCERGVLRETEEALPRECHHKLPGEGSPTLTVSSAFGRS